MLPKVKEFMEKPDWIIDGYYTYLMIDERLESADEIILLLLPRLTCFFRALKRTKLRRKDGYKNDMNWWFLKFIFFGCRNKKRRAFYNEITKKYKNKTVVLKTKRQVDEFLRSM